MHLGDTKAILMFSTTGQPAWFCHRHNQFRAH